MDKSENPTQENQDDNLDKCSTVLEPEKSSRELLAGELTLIHEELTALKPDNQDRKEQLEQQNGFYKDLIEEMKQSDRASMGRHVWLTDSLKQSMKAQKQIAAAATENGDNPPKKGFFARLLGR